MSTYDELIGKIISWAENTLNVKAVFVIGSRARIDNPADEYSDLDLVMVVANTEHFFISTQWLENISSFWMSFIERTTFSGNKEIRVMFENALDVDFMIIDEKDFREVVENNEAKAVFKRAYRVLVDKKEMAEYLLQINTKCEAYVPPSESEFLNSVNDFLYHSIWTIKKLKRGELWSAKSCVDNYMKMLLLRIIEWHTHTIKGWDYDTWHNGRFLDKWADKKVKDGLQHTFARYNARDVGKALLATMDLFRTLATGIAGKMGFEYPYEADKNAADWVRGSLAKMGIQTKRFS